eukprot:m.105653 g.105653  ORF g.105653 m.105653 type:complete len:229 (-) comp27667_c0_seq1:147-833(-)
MAWRDFVYFALIVAIVPFQMYLTQNTAPVLSFDGRGDWAAGGHGLFAKGYENAKNVFSEIQSPLTFFRQLERIKTALRRRANDGTDEDSCGATEVVRFNYFGNGRVPRTNRQGVKFRLGQIVRHKHKKYKAIIIGWDRHANAPQSWLSKHVDADLQLEPMYSLLVDNKAQNLPGQKVYITQNALEIEEDVQECRNFRHAKLPQMFTSYYQRMQIWLPIKKLKRSYPKD